MCKTWSLVYSCEHTFQFRLSKCRATVYTQSRPGRPHRPACMGGVALVFKKAYPCGDCAIKGRQQELAAFRDTLEEGSREREAAEAKMMAEMFKAERSYPIVERYRKPKPHEKCGLKPTELKGSLLKHEVLREDLTVEADDEAWNAYHDEWSSGWATVSDDDAEVSSWDSQEADATSCDTTWDLPIEDMALQQVDSNPWEVEWNWDNFSRDASSDDIVEAPRECIFQPPVQQNAIIPSTNTACSIPYTIGDAKKRATSFERNNSIQPTTTESWAQPPTRQENEKFNTMPPHLRKQKAALHRRPSEPDLRAKFTCFPFQTVITVNT